jgi:anti-sigma B factor antagonist
VNSIPFDAQKEELEGGVQVLTVRGELDMNTAPELERLLGQAMKDEGAEIILDLTECEFIDSTGIALLVRSWQRVDRNAGGEGRGRLVLCSVNHQVRRLLEITGVESSISLHEKRDDAIAELRG